MRQDVGIVPLAKDALTCEGSRSRWAASFVSHALASSQSLYCRVLKRSVLIPAWLTAAMAGVSSNTVTAPGTMQMREN